MTETGGVPIVIVDKLVDTIKEFNKQIIDSNIAINECAKDVSMLIEINKKIADQVTTPPRHIEIHDKATKILNKIEEKDGILEKLINLGAIVTSAVSEVKSAFVIVAIAIVVAAVVATGVNYYMDKTPKTAIISEEEHKALEKKIEELKKTIEQFNKKSTD